VSALPLAIGSTVQHPGSHAPTRNNLSHADKVRPAEMAEKLFWAVFEHLGQLSHVSVSGAGRKRFARQVQAPDSSGGFDHYSADCFLYGLGPTSARNGGGQVSSAAGFAKFSARFAIVDTARHNDARRARNGAGSRPVKSSF